MQYQIGKSPSFVYFHRYILAHLVNYISKEKSGCRSFEVQFDTNFIFIIYERTSAAFQGYRKGVFRVPWPGLLTGLFWGQRLGFLQLLRECRLDGEVPLVFFLPASFSWNVEDTNSTTWLRDFPVRGLGAGRQGPGEADEARHCSICGSWLIKSWPVDFCKMKQRSI